MDSNSPPNDKSEIADRLEITKALGNFLYSYPYKPFYYCFSEKRRLTDWFIDSLSRSSGSRYLVAKKQNRYDCVAVLNFSRFDTQVFGRKMGRISRFITANKSPRAYLSRICDYFIENDYAFVDASINAMESNLLPVFQAEQFVVVGANVTMSAEIAGSDIKPAGVSPAKIRKLNDADIPILSALTRKSFSDITRNRNRFLVDGHFTNRRVAEMYGRWFENCARGDRAKQIFVAECRGVPVGYIACNIIEGIDGLKIGKIPLNAVDAAYERKGIYTRLLQRALAFFASEGCKYAEIKTQLSTLATQYAWHKYGARPVKIDYNLHRWLKPATGKGCRE